MSEEKKSVSYRAGQNDYRAGNPISTGDELWDVFRIDWLRGWNDAKRSDAKASSKR